MGRDSSVLVYFSNPAITIDDAEKALRFEKPRRSGNSLYVSIRDREHASPPTEGDFAIGLSTASHVILEAQEIAEMKNQPALGTCDRRFEVLVADLEAAMQDYNTLFGIEESLARLTNGWVFMSWNGDFSFAPEPDASAPKTTKKKPAGKKKPVAKKTKSKKPAKKKR